MRRTAKVAVGAGTVVVLVGAAAVLFGPGLYADRANETAPEAPALGQSAVPLPDPESAAGTWTVSDGSFAGYRTQEVLRGEEATVTGRTEQVTGSVTVADGAVTEAVVEVDIASVASDEPARDSYFRGQAMEVGEFPTGTFELTEPAPIEEGALAVELAGELTVHGVTRPATVEAEVAGDASTGDPVQVIGSVPITFADFDVAAPALGFVTVEDEGSIEFSLQLRPAQ